MGNAERVSLYLIKRLSLGKFNIEQNTVSIGTLLTNKSPSSWFCQDSPLHAPYTVFTETFGGAMSINGQLQGQCA